MGKLKTGVLSVTGLVVGIVTLRSLRKRRATPEEEAATAVEEARSETEEAASHAASAAGHARVAGEKAIEYVREERLDDTGDDETERPEPTSRVQKLGKRLGRQ